MLNLLVNVQFVNLCLKILLYLGIFVKAAINAYLGNKLCLHGGGRQRNIMLRPSQYLK